MGTPLRLFLCLFLTGIHISLYSQAEESRPADRVSIKGTYTLKKIFDLIYRQTKQQITYANTLLDDRERVTVDVSGTIDEALTVILAGKAITWVYSEGYVALRRKSAGQKISTGLSSSDDNPLITISGIVKDEEGNPLPGATVIMKGTANGTSTNANGSFSLNIPVNSAILISYTGFEHKEIIARKENKLSIFLKKSVSSLEETVIVAYNTTTQRANTGAITIIKGEQIQSLPNRSFDRSLQGLVPGLLVTKGTGQPGAGVSNMVLRGISTGANAAFGSTARNPLIVIDGVPVSQDNFQTSVGENETPITNPLAQFNPSDIETISVLKDAVAIALYGSKASNGVVLVTTKKGKVGKTVYSFRHQTDIATRLRGNIKPLDRQEYLSLLYETYKNTDPVFWTDQAILDDLKTKFPTRSDGSFYPSPDWHRELFSDNAPTISNQLSMSGGNERSNFYLNLEYTKQDGIVRQTGYDRKSMRFNFESRPASWFKLGINSAFSYNIQNSAGTGDDAVALSPLLPIRLENGNYQFVYSQGASSLLPNPAAVAAYNIDRNVAYHGISKLSGEVRFLKYLTLSSNIGIDFMLNEAKQKNDPRLHEITTPRIAERDIRRSGLINTNMLRFGKTLHSGHSLNLILGQEAQINTERVLAASAVGTAETLPYYDQLTSPGYTKDQINSYSIKQTQLSLFGQINYDYQNKYFLSSSVRRDASSKFGDQQQWGTYWSAGAGWIVTAEPFIKKELPWLNYFKLRGSMGVVGNSGALDAMVRFDRITKFRYLDRDVVVPSGLGNPDARWEKTFNWNAGMEVRLLRERISITADVYEKRTSDLLYLTNLPSIAGDATVVDNIGDINNKGIELSLSADVIKNKTFFFSLGATWSTNRNILVKANVPLSALTDGILGNEEGRNFNSFYMPIWAGVNPADGKPQWLDNTGKPTSEYNEAKKEFVGKPQPNGFGTFTPSFGYKGFSLSAQLYYLYGAQTYDLSLSNSLLTDGMNPYINSGKQALNYWKSPGDIAINPRRVLNNTDMGNLTSTRYLFYSGYIRLSNVMLAYAFPKKILEPLHASQLSLFVQGNNLAIITNFSGPDPDNANVGGSTRFEYPNEKTFSIGLNISFQ
jgi:TonB-linked SusC/RagA family outer membrane protein